MIGSQASCGLSFVKWSAFLKGLPKGVKNRGVIFLEMKLGVLLGVLAVGVLDGTGWSGVERSGDRDRDGEWNCEWGADVM